MGAQDAPDPLPMPLQGILYAPAAHRFMRARSKALSGSPVGQIIGRVDGVRPAKDVVFDIIDEYIDTMQRIATGMNEPSESTGGLPRDARQRVDTPQWFLDALARRPSTARPTSTA